MPAKENSNLKLGFFVLAGSFLLILTLYFIGMNQNLFGSNFELRARFQNAGGLISGNNIRFSGLQVGTVKNIKLIDDTTIEVTMLIAVRMKSFIHKNALASIGTEGLMGNKIINIIPGKGPAPKVEEGDLLAAQRMVNTDEMLQTLSRTNNNIADLAEGLKTAVQKLNNSKALWGMLNEASLADNLKTSLSNIGAASIRTNQMMQDLQAIIGDVRAGKGSVGILLKDTGFAYNLEEAIAKIKTVGSKAADLMGEVNSMTGAIQQDINTGAGPAHALLKDSSMVRKLNASLENVQKGTQSFSQDMEALKHNFLFRGYFRKLEKQQKKQAGEQVPSNATGE